MNDDVTLGVWIAEQRRRKVPWKVLMEETGYGRTKLNELLWTATGGGGLEALGVQVVDAVRKELEKGGVATVSVNEKTIVVQMSITTLPPN